MQVAVGGTPSSSNNSAGSIMDLTLSLGESQLLKSGILIGFDRSPTFRPKESVQGVAVHELTHAVDYQDEVIMEEDGRAQKALLRKVRGLALGCLIVAPLVTAETASATHFGNTLECIAIGAITGLIGLIKGGGKAQKMQLKAYLENPMEKRAYAVMEKADDIPAIVSVKPLTA